MNWWHFYGLFLMRTYEELFLDMFFYHQHEKLYVKYVAKYDLKIIFIKNASFTSDKRDIYHIRNFPLV